METAVKLAIKYQDENGVVEEYWEDSLESAKEIAARWVNVGLADWVEIRDDQGQLLAHMPRVIHGA